MDKYIAERLVEKMEMTLPAPPGMKWFYTGSMLKEPVARDVNSGELGGMGITRKGATVEEVHYYMLVKA
jgi:hypothetical protein